MGPAVACPDKRGGYARGIGDAFPPQPCLEMLRHGRDVLHDQVGPLEHTFVDMLEDIVSDTIAFVELAQVGFVDESRAEALGLRENAGKIEVEKDGGDHGIL